MISSLISIITPSFNRADLIAQAVESVMTQGYPNFEHIIVDGGSTDSTMKVLSRYPHLRIISESDDGMYYAINKGIKLAKGDVTGLLNTDDAYVPGIFQQVASLFQANPDIQAVNGTAQVFSEVQDERRMIAEYPYILKSKLPCRVTKGIPAINSWFFRTQVFSRLGCFETSYRISADRHFLLKFLYHGLSYQNLYEPVYLYRQHEASMTITGRDVYYENYVFEHLRMAEEFILDLHTPVVMKKACRSWHGRDTAELAVRALWTYPSRFHEYTSRGIKFNILWPLYFIYRLARRAIRYLIIKK